MKRGTELAALRTIAAALAAEVEDAGVFEIALDALLPVLRADAGFIALPSNAAPRLACHRGVPAAAVPALERSLREGGLLGDAFTAAPKVIVGDRRTGGLGAMGEHFGTLAAMPVVHRGENRLVLGCMRRRERPLSSRELDWLRTGGGLLALAADRLGQPSHVAGSERELRLLRAAEMVNRSLDSPTLEKTILAEAARLLDVEKAALLLVRGDVLIATEVHGLSDRFARLFVVPLEESTWGSSILAGHTVAVEDVRVEKMSDPRVAAEGGYRSYVTAPLESLKGTYGALSLFCDRARRFSEHEKMQLRTFAMQAAIALDNRRLMREKDQMAVHDGLTGVYNRRYLELSLERSAKELQRNGGTVSILFLDLDGMKAVNDDHGHEAGDRLLVDVATILEQSCRQTDVVARYGGDEFVVLMPNTDAIGADHVAGKVERAIEYFNATTKGPVRLAASMGRHTAGAADLGDLLREADRRMYAMKWSRNTGRGGDRRPRGAPPA